MEYVSSNANGTNDDPPPSYRYMSTRGGRLPGNGRYPNNAFPYHRGQNDIESQIHLLEQEAYISVLRAFKAQSDALTWEKEGLITELRKELRVSYEEHRELLSKVNKDDAIKTIREWRQAGGRQTELHNTTHTVYESLGSPPFSGSPKRQKTVRSLSMNEQIGMGVTSSATLYGSKGKRPYYQLTGVSTMKSLQTPFTNRRYSGVTTSTEPVACNSLVGKQVWLKWPKDNMFYEATITDYNATEGTHAVVYNINTRDEEWEWVNLNKILPDDIRWEAPGIGQPGGQTHTDKEKALLNNQPTENLVQLKIGHENLYDEIKILNTESVIKEVETVFASSHVDPFEIDKAKKKLREHEQSLIDAIAMLTETARGENEGNVSLHNQQWMRQHAAAATYLHDSVVA